MDTTGKRRPNSGWLGSVTSISSELPGGFWKGASCWQVVALLDVALDEPLDPSPVPGDLREGSVTTSAGPKAVRMRAELRLVVGVQQGAQHFLQQFVRPGRYPERSHLPRLFGDIRPPDRGPSIALQAQRVNERIDLPQRHGIHGFRRRARGHRTVVAVDPPVGTKVEVAVVQLPIDVLQRQPSSATFTNDSQNRVGVSHLAYLDVLVVGPPVSLRHVDGSPVRGLLRRLRRRGTRVP